MAVNVGAIGKADRKFSEKLYKYSDIISHVCDGVVEFACEVKNDGTEEQRGYPCFFAHSFP